MTRLNNLTRKEQNMSLGEPTMPTGQTNEVESDESIKERRDSAFEKLKKIDEKESLTDEDEKWLICGDVEFAFHVRDYALPEFPKHPKGMSSHDWLIKYQSYESECKELRALQDRVMKKLAEYRDAKYKSYEEGLGIYQKEAIPFSKEDMEMYARIKKYIRASIPSDEIILEKVEEYEKKYGETNETGEDLTPEEVEEIKIALLKKVKYPY